jgi:hypothetical protein
MALCTVLAWPQFSKLFLERLEELSPALHSRVLEREI